MLFMADASKPSDSGVVAGSGSANEGNTLDGSQRSRSNSGMRTEDPLPNTSSSSNNSSPNSNSLAPCFTDNVYIFSQLFCSPTTVDWSSLGETAYSSFQNFDAGEARNSKGTTDALWRICLCAGSDVVAGKAMSDLLDVYNKPSTAAIVVGVGGAHVSTSASVSASDSATSGEESNQFSQRIFTCLSQVRTGLQNAESTSERSAERCIRILSAAIEQCSNLGGSASAVEERLKVLLKSTTGQEEEVAVVEGDDGKVESKSQKEDLVHEFGVDEGKSTEGLNEATNTTAAATKMKPGEIGRAHV